MGVYSVGEYQNSHILEQVLVDNHEGADTCRHWTRDILVRILLPEWIKLTFCLGPLHFRSMG
jgi:hypothetical protein